VNGIHLKLRVGELLNVLDIRQLNPPLSALLARCPMQLRALISLGAGTLLGVSFLHHTRCLVVIGQCYARHRHQEFLKFLQRLEAEFPSEIKLHVVMDNYGTHKHPRVQRWLKRHKRLIPHFVPTSSSWLNLVERWFGELTGKRIRRGVFVSVEDLQKAIEEFLAAWNNDPKPFVWMATMESIIEKLSRCKQTLERIKPGCTRPRMRKTKGK
jgi:transposase